MPSSRANRTPAPITREAGVRGVSPRWLQQVLSATRRHLGIQREVSVAIVGRRTSRTLNRRYRRRDRPTNVLSFGLGPAPAPLGELVLCWPVVQAEAVRYGRTLKAHAALLIVHGVLHLLGDDHTKASTEARMVGREQRALTALKRRHLL